MGEQLLDRGLDAIEHRFGVHAQEHDQREQRGDDQGFGQAQLTEALVRFGDRSVEDPLVGPQQVQRRQDHADHRDDAPPAGTGEGTEQDEELTRETVQAGKADARQHDQCEHTGEDRRGLLQSGQLRDLAGVTTLVDPADEEEQRTGRDAVVDHDQHAALEPLRGEREHAEHDETEVGDRGVGDEALQVLLHRCADGAVDDADDSEGHHHRGGPDGGLGEQVDAETHEPVGAELQHHRREDHRTCGGRLGVGVRQPGVQREQRHLDCEGDGEADEDPATGVGGDGLVLCDLHQIEGDRSAHRLGVQHRQRHQRDEHERRAEHRVQEELVGGVDAPAVPPEPDQVVHRHEDELEEGEEHHQVECAEHAHRSGHQHQQPPVVGLRVVVDLRPEHGDREDHTGQHHQEQRDAVDPEVHRDAQVADPRLVDDELVAGVAGIERGEHVDRHGAGDDAGDHGDLLEQVGPVAWDQGDDRGADERRHDQRRDQREAARLGARCLGGRRCR